MEKLFNNEILFHFNFDLSLFDSDISSGVMDISRGLRGSSISNITSWVMDIRLSKGVDQARVQSMVDMGDSNIGKTGMMKTSIRKTGGSIRIGTKTISVRKDYWGSSILWSRSAKSPM